MDGHNVLVQGIPEKISTKNLELQIIAPDWRYQFLRFLTHSATIYLLILVAFYGLLFEFSKPGFILPGIIGGIALLLVLYSLWFTPLNYTALTLIAVGILLIIIELIRENKKIK